jgi:hypothetical protein
MFTHNMANQKAITVDEAELQTYTAPPKEHHNGKAITTNLCAHTREGTECLPDLLLVMQRAANAATK